MEKLRFILAMLFLTEVIIGLMHLVVYIFFDKEYPLQFYWIAPIFILGVILFATIMAPVLSWIIGG